MDIDVLDFLAVNAPDTKLTYDDVNKILGYPDDEYGRIPTQETVILAHCVWRYEWAQTMLKAKRISAQKNAAGK